MSDATATALMRRFYENLADGRDAAEALTRSKVRIIEELGSDALATVSAFQMIGVGDHRVSTQSTPLKTTSSGVGR